jgi:hypothetical protein
MPKNVDKIVPFLAVAVLGYLTYGIVDVGAGPPAPKKDAPAITKAMLRPELVVAQNHASPAGRDPFEVAWASYLHPAKSDAATGRAKPASSGEDVKPESSAEGAGSGPPSEGAKPGAPPSGSGPPSEGAKPGAPPSGSGQPPAGVEPAAEAARAEPKPPPEPPPLPLQLSSICISTRGRMAVIDGKVYRKGDSIKRTDAAAGWVIESIETYHVVLGFGGVRHTLQMARPGAADHAEKKPDGKR